MVTKTPLGLISSAYNVIQQEGLADFASKVFRWWRIQKKDSLTLSCDGVSATFDTSSDVAMEWFYPRYLDGDLHEPVMTRQILKSLDQEMTFYDVGALVGYYSVFASNLCSGGSVHSFEIDHRFVDSIRDSLLLNHGDASVVNRAVSEKSGDEVSYEGDVGVTSISNGISENVVETLSLDDYVSSNESPEVMKIDVEGFEYKVLSGAVNTLQKGKPNILFLEMHPSMLKNYDDSVDDVLSLLQKHDYTYTIIGNHREDDSQTEISEVKGNVVLRCQSPEVH